MSWHTSREPTTFPDGPGAGPGRGVASAGSRATGGPPGAVRVRHVGVGTGAGVGVRAGDWVGLVPRRDQPGHEPYWTADTGTDPGGHAARATGSPRSDAETAVSDGAGQSGHDGTPHGRTPIVDSSSTRSGNQQESVGREVGAAVHAIPPPAPSGGRVGCWGTGRGLLSPLLGPLLGPSRAVWRGPWTRARPAN